MAVLSKITTADLYKWENVLSRHLHSGESDWSDVIANGLDVIHMEMRNRKLKTRLLGTKLQIVDSDDTLTGIENSSLSSEDYAERTRLVLTVDTLDGSDECKYKLQGTNDGGTNYVDVVSEQTADSTGEKTHTFLDVYKKYRFSVTNADAVVSNVYLMERSFELPHIYLSLALAFRSIKNDPDSLRLISFTSFPRMRLCHYSQRCAAPNNLQG